MSTLFILFWLAEWLFVSRYILFLSHIQVNEHRQKLKDLEDLIANLGTSQDTVSDKAFEERLKEAEKAIMDLLRDAENMRGI